MGYRVRKYDLNELKTIALPGRVVPCLFWVLPVGAWALPDLESLWHHFTDSRGVCRDFGLLLVREWGHDSSSATTDLNLDGVAANLRDVLPGGSRFDFPVEERHARSLLFLSSAYPQPGWGVLFPIAHELSATNVVEDLTRKAMNGFSVQSEQDLDALRAAANAFHRWQDAKQPKQCESDQTDVIRRGIVKRREVLAAATNLVAALESGSSKDVERKVPGLIQAIRESTVAMQREQIIAELTLRQQVLKNARFLAGFPDDRLVGELMPAFRAAGDDASEQRRHLAARTDDHARNALRALFQLASLQPIGANVAETIAAAQAMACDKIGCTAKVVAELTNSELPQVQEHLDRLEAEARIARARLVSEEIAARSSMAAAMTRAAEVQWQLGPRFLASLEAAAGKGAMAPIVWDGPRMVGWKLHLAGGGITLEELRISARELGVTPPEVQACQKPGIEQPIDGSYFTDYVHFIAMLSPDDHPPREVTRRLLATLLRPNTLRDMIERHGGICLPDSERDVRAELLITCLGWPGQRRATTGALARFCRIESKPGQVLADADLIPLRRSLESFCKDVLHVLTQQLGYSDQAIWSAIDNGAPRYRPTSPRHDWAEEINVCTAGSAAVLIGRLGGAWRPDKEHEFGRLTNTVGGLANILNPEFHEKRGGDVAGIDSSRIASFIDEALKVAASLLGELPWHFLPTVQYGSMPRVLSGMGWSHAHETPRMLRVLEFEEGPVGDEMLVWNRSGTNPVMADPVFLDRNRHRRR